MTVQLFYFIKNNFEKFEKLIIIIIIVFELIVHWIDGIHFFASFCTQHFDKINRSLLVLLIHVRKIIMEMKCLFLALN